VYMKSAPNLCKWIPPPSYAYHGGYLSTTIETDWPQRLQPIFSISVLQIRRVLLFGTILLGRRAEGSVTGRIPNCQVTCGGSLTRRHRYSSVWWRPSAALWPHCSSTYSFSRSIRLAVARKNATSRTSVMTDSTASVRSPMSIAMAAAESWCGKID